MTSRQTSQYFKPLRETDLSGGKADSVQRKAPLVVGGNADSVQRKAPLVVCKRDAADSIYSVEMKEPSTSVQSDGEQICVKSMASDRESYTKNGVI